MEVLPWVFSSGWASGINAYAVVVLMGFFGRLGVDGVPPALERTDVMAVAAVLFVLDTVADKVPYLDSTWDVVHTAIRPTAGAVIGVLLAGEAGTLNEAVAGVTGGASAFASHLVKAGLRAAVNTSPEPASNIAVSTAEDLTVAGVVSLSVLNPLAAAITAAVLLLIGAVLVALLLSRIRRFRREWRDRRERRAASTGSHYTPSE